MKVSELNKIVNFLIKNQAERTIYVNVNENIPFTLENFDFIPKSIVQGIVFFGKGIPFSGLDVKLKDLLRVIDLIENTNCYGCVIKSPGGDPVFYLECGKEMFMENFKPLK